MRTGKRRIWLVALILLILLASAAVWFFWDAFTETMFRDKPDHVTITVAWNPHSTADDMVRALSGGMDTQVTLQNIPGANGANGANHVWNAARDGGELLSTSLSAFVTSEAMGFAESSHSDWTVWLCTFSPAVVVVAAESPYSTMEDLITAMRHNSEQLRCANPGFGTVGFAAAQLLSTRITLEFEHIDHAGNSPAINALLEGEADFAILLSVEAVERLNTGEIRALGAFGETTLAPSVTGIDARLDAVLPFGEYYGLFIPVDVPAARLNGLTDLIESATASDMFVAMLNEKNLTPVTLDRNQSNEITEHIASLLCWTLYDTGYLPISPDTIGVSRR